jgi:two-component sensor histidine kinase
MVWRGYLDLPSELAGKLPRAVTEIMVAFAAIGLAVGGRVALDQFIPGVIPFVLTFPAIAIATLMAGPRAGLVTLAGCQLLVWYAVMPPYRSFVFESPAQVVSLLLSTAAQLVMLWAIGAYRGMTGQLAAENRQRIEDLSLALREIDHRTKNNFQLAVGMLDIQGRNATDPELRSALSRAAARLQAIGGVYKNLALSSADLNLIRLHDYLADVCGRVREGLLSPAVQLELKAEPVMVPHDHAIRIGLIINELVTNAAKHAFPEGVGHVLVALEDLGDALRLTVRDDGTGFDQEKTGDGLGARMIQMLARQLNAQVTTGADTGTSYVFVIPHPARG